MNFHFDNLEKYKHVKKYKLITIFYVYDIQFRHIGVLKLNPKKLKVESFLALLHPSLKVGRPYFFKQM